MKSLIVRPITKDGLVGYDEFDQFMICEPDGDARKYWHGWDVRALTCAICARGWEPTGPSIADQVRWDLLDAQVHRSCLERHAGLVERAEYRAALVQARVRFRLRPVPNAYWSDPKAKPWYHAELIDHPVRFVLGARKRVDHVEVVAEGGTELAWFERAREAFAAEDVTKWFGPAGVGLHAWSRTKMEDYVRRLVELGDLAKPRPR